MDIRRELYGDWLRLLATILIGLVFIKSSQASTGDDAACEKLNERALADELKVDEDALNLMNGSLQGILNCVPAKTNVVVYIPEYPVQERLTINKPVTLSSSDGQLLLGCDGMNIRSDDVTIRGLRIQGCEIDDLTGPIHVKDVRDILLDNLECLANVNNGGGPACISAFNSTVTLENVLATNNTSEETGGFLAASISDFNLQNCTFVRNSGFHGGAIAVEHGSFRGENISIISNKANETGGGIYGKDVDLHLENCTIASNTVDFCGGGISLEGKRMHLKNCNISSNAVTNGNGAGICGQNIDLLVEGSTIESNKATEDGGGIHGENVKLRLKNSSISKNDAYNTGGGIYGQNTALYVESCNISFNSAKMYGGGICGQKSDMDVASSRFCGNEAYSGGGIYSDAAKAGSVLNSYFVNNSVEREGGGAYLGDGHHWSLKHSWFGGNIARVGGGAISVSEARNFHVYESTFHVNIVGNLSHESQVRFPTSSGGALFLLGKKTRGCSLSKSNFSDNSAGMGGAIWAQDLPTLKLSNCRLQDNSAVIGGALGCKNTGKMDDIGSIFLHNYAHHGGAISLVGSQLNREDDMMDYSLGSGEVKNTLSESEFFANEAGSEGGAIDISGFSFECMDCTFESNKAGKLGGGLRVRFFSVIKLSSTEVRHCTSAMGAGISLEDAAMYTYGLTLTGNNASDVGAAIAATYPSIFVRKAYLLGCDWCSFQGNRANRGGIVYFHVDREMPKSDIYAYQAYFSLVSFADNVVENNSGPVMMFSTFAATRVCCNYMQDCTENNGIQNSSCFDQGAVNQSRLGTLMKQVEVSPKLIHKYSSGDQLDSITVILVDDFGNPASVNATLTVKADVEISGRPTTGVYITKESVVDGIILRAAPGSYDITLEIHSLEADVDIVQDYITVEVRNCTVGEIAANENKACEQCPVDFYNFGSNATCDECKVNAVCDGKTLVPRDGYWHSSSLSDELHNCLNENACSYDNRIETLREQAISNFPSEVDWDGNYTLCSRGYKGKLCGSCVNGYGRHASGNCKECPRKNSPKQFWKSMSIPASLGLLCLMVVLAVQSAMEYSKETIDRGELERTQTTVLRRFDSRVISPGPDHVAGSTIDPGDILKILINFLQISTTIKSIDPEWQSNVLKALDILDWLSGMTSATAYYSFSCSFKGTNRFIFATSAAVMLPLTVLGAFIGYGAIKFSSKSMTKKEFTTFCFVSAMAIVDISYLGWTEKMARIWYCQDLHDGSYETYWTEDTSIVCHGNPHKYLLYLVGLPLLVFVTLGFPLFLGLKLYFSRDKLHTESLVSCYGYFYQGYHSRCAYWEVLIHLRKGLIAVISVLSGGAITHLFGSCLTLGVLVFAGALQNFADPFKENKLNTMEALSLFISSFIFILGSMLYSDEANTGGRTWLIVLLMAVPITFVAYMGFEYLNAWKENIHVWLRDQEEYLEYEGGVLSYLRIYLRAIYARSKARMDELSVRIRSIRMPQIGIGRSTGRTGSSLGDEASVSGQERDNTTPLLW